jgi:hypothetical protein
MKQAKGLKKFTRSKKAHPSDYVTFLTNYQDGGPNFVGTSKVESIQNLIFILGIQYREKMSQI